MTRTPAAHLAEWLRIAAILAAALTIGAAVGFPVAALVYVARHMEIHE
jgi:hypothetical protein